jgi:hypothetical protein
MSNVKLTEVVTQKAITSEGTVGIQNGYTLREVYVNPEHVVCMRADNLMKRKLTENLLPTDMDQRQEFTKIYINRGHTGLDITVVGSPSAIEGKMFETQTREREILKG